MKRETKKIILRKVLLLCLFVAPIHLFCKTNSRVYTNDKVTVERICNQTGKKVIGTINGEPFFKEDMDVYVIKARALVAAHYGQKYNLNGMGDAFWETRFGSSTPREFLNDLAMNDLVKNMVIIQEARARGLDTPQTYNNLEKERTIWNNPTDDIVYGPKKLAPAEYNSYRISEVTDELKTVMLRNELAPTEDQTREAFLSIPEEYLIAPYSASGIRFNWDSGSEQDANIRADIDCLLQQGFSPDEVILHLSDLYEGLTYEKFEMNSRYISKENENEIELAELLRDAPTGACLSGLDNQAELYYVTHTEGGGSYTFEKASRFGRSKWINDQFEKFLELKVDEAIVTLFTEPEISAIINLTKYSTVSEAPGNGTLKSRGKASTESVTYYVDYNNGNDANSGTSPLKPWKTFNNVNLKTFNPGDHILLEANSIWNGTPADKDNYIDQAKNRGNGGMLAPLGSGVEGEPCVIDLYEIKEENGVLTVYWSADKRPVINGNGTPYLDIETPYRMSGTIQLEGQNYWEIRNIEVTNSYDFPLIATNLSLLETHWYKREVPKSLVGINVIGTESNSLCKGILIENCYIHDVQSLHSNNRAHSEGDWYKSKHFGPVVGNPGKSGGGIFGSFTESTIQENIIKRVGLEGFHSSQRLPGEKFIFRGNYIESVAGDGIVISNFVGDNLVESNLIKDACAAPNFGVACYASCWTYRSSNVLFQYNEAWGTLYGYWDGEAWDVDNDCDQVIYQYNYSHHNAGGTILFMNTQTNSIFRYNISANDGGGSRYMRTLESPGTQTVDQSAESYKFWTEGQSLIHYSLADTIGSSRIPLVHNNTFYLGEGISASIYGCVWKQWADKYIRFYNNIILKTGNGEVRFSDVHGPEEQPYIMKDFKNPEGFKNNLLYAYQTDRKQGDKTKFLTGRIPMNQWLTAHGNIWADPKLKVQKAGGDAALRKQRDDHFLETDYSNTEKFREYTSVNRLRMRASLFTPLEGSPAIESGMKIPVGKSVRDVDGAWNGNIGNLSDIPAYWNNVTGLTKDMFGNDINPSKPPIGGAVKEFP